MAAPVTDHNNGDIIDASHVNDIHDYIETADFRINTDSLSINGTQVINTTGDISLSQTSTTGSALDITRNLGSASTDSPVVSIVQDEATDDQVAIFVRNDGTRGAIAFSGVTSDPSGPSAGDLWYNSTDNVLRYYNGTSTIDLTDSGGSGTGEAIVLKSQTVEGTVSVGDLVHYNAAGSQWERSNSVSRLQGILSASGEVTLFGRVTGLSGLTAGQFHFQDSSTPHTLTTTAGDVKVGFAMSSTELLLDIDFEGTGNSSAIATLSDAINSDSHIAVINSDTLDSFSVVTNIIDAHESPQSGSGQVWGREDGGATLREQAVSFIMPATVDVGSVEARPWINFGSPTNGDYTVEIWTDSSGDPGSIVDANATTNFNPNEASGSPAWHTMTFSSSFTLTGGNTYWIVFLSTQTGDNSMRIEYDGNGSDSDSVTKRRDDGGAWETLSDDLLYRVNAG